MSVIKKVSVKDLQDQSVLYDIGADATNVSYDQNTSVKDKIDAVDTVFTGATSAANGTNGLVPAPQAGDENKALRGNGTWGSVDSGEIISYADWLLLTPEEQATGDYYVYNYGGSIMPIGGSVVPVGGFDSVPTQGSINPVTSNGIYSVTGDKTNLTTVDKTNLVSAINEVKAQADKCEVYKVTISSVSALPVTYPSSGTDANIEDNMEVVNSTLSNTAAQLSEWTWTIPDGGGSITISPSGAISGTTDITLLLMKSR